MRSEGVRDRQQVRVADTDAFLDRCLPDRFGVVDNIVQELGRRGLYHVSEERWDGFPDVDATAWSAERDQLCAAFTRLANFIIAEADNLLLGGLCSHSRWVDYHSVAGTAARTGAGSNTMRDSRPDCALVLSELHSADEKAWEKGTDQDQQDRRFVLGLSIGARHLTVWLQDRSGILGTETPIAYHENPEQLVQILVALVAQPEHALGSDPTMKVYRGLSDPPIPVYQLAGDAAESYMTSVATTRWVVEMGDGRSYLTLDAFDEEHPSNDGLITWAAMNYADREKNPEERKIYLLKQLWRASDSSAIFELDVDASDSDYVAKTAYHERVKLDGSEDTTASSIRRGLNCVRPPSGLFRTTKVIGVPIYNEPPVQAADDHSMDCVRTRTVLSTFGLPLTYFADRVELVRTVLDGVKGDRDMFARNILSADICPDNILIRALENGAPTGCLVNVDYALREASSLRAATESDHVANIDTPTEDFEETVDLIENTMKVLSKRGAIPNRPDFERTVLAHALRAVEDGDSKSRQPCTDVIPTVSYLTATASYIHRSSNTSPGARYTLQTLRWNVDVPPSRPTLDSELLKQQPWSRPTSIPYVSPELSGAQPLVFACRNSGRYRHIGHPVYWDAVHNVEAFFWSLLYICITRDGPGSHRRRELTCNMDEIRDPAEKAAVQSLRHITNCFFDGDAHTLLVNKRNLHRAAGTDSDDDFVKHVLPHVAPYFEPFKDTLRNLFDVLMLAYAFRAFEYRDIHSRAIAILEDLLNRLHLDHREDSSRARAYVLKKRGEYMHGLRHSV
ncbi:hypothetical protein BD626DRAFT_506572 [Schizophyllum amplum]|uniref:Fungal-type protein kinase domain-containing protein n=1 Tax=Schizophyllum amplum TaxID=97359 RepID=A0A550C551_9AGAR|nr:hypothetical protein BD626DRAFT_506572 [Auriculariopsis ampla]